MITQEWPCICRVTQDGRQLVAVCHCCAEVTWCTPASQIAKITNTLLNPCKHLTYRITGSLSDYYLYFSLAICLYFHCKKKGKIKCWKCLHTFQLDWNQPGGTAASRKRFLSHCCLCICGTWDSAGVAPQVQLFSLGKLSPPLNRSFVGSADWSLSKSLWLGRKHYIPLVWAKQTFDNFYSCVHSKIFLIFENIQS